MISLLFSQILVISALGPIHLAGAELHLPSLTETVNI